MSRGAWWAAGVVALVVAVVHFAVAAQYDAFRNELYFIVYRTSPGLWVRRSAAARAAACGVDATRRHKYLAAAASGRTRCDRSRTAHRALRAVAWCDHARSLACRGCRRERDARDRDDGDAIHVNVRADRVHRARLLHHARLRARRAARVLVGGRDRRRRL